MAAFSMSEVKVGIMVILAVGFLVALTIAVGNIESLMADTIVVQILVPNVVGLDSYSKITYNGVRIGSIVKMENTDDGRMAVVKAKINRDSPVSLDSIVNFTSDSLLSPLFINITGGSEEKRISLLLNQEKFDEASIPPLMGEAYTSINDVFALAGDVKDVLAKVELILDDLHYSLADAGGLISSVSAEFTVALREVRETVQEARPEFLQIFQNANSMIAEASRTLIPTLENVRISSATLPLIIDDTRAGVNDVMNRAAGLIAAVSPDLTETAKEVRLILQDLRERMQRLEGSLVRVLDDADSLMVDNKEVINRIVIHLERTMANLDDMSQQLARDPWRLLWPQEGRRAPLRESPEWRPDFGTNTPVRQDASP